MNLKGTLPTLVLKVLMGGPLHGYLIAKEIKHRSKGVLDFREGTLYPVLHTLEDRGLIASREHTENGRVLRRYKLTERGIETLAAERRAWRDLSSAVSLVLEDR